VLGSEQFASAALQMYQNALDRADREHGGDPELVKEIQWQFHAYMVDVNSEDFVMPESIEHVQEDLEAVTGNAFYYFENSPEFARS